MLKYRLAEEYSFHSVFPYNTDAENMPESKSKIGSTTIDIENEGQQPQNLNPKEKKEKKSGKDQKKEGKSGKDQKKEDKSGKEQKKEEKSEKDQSGQKDYVVDTKNSSKVNILPKSTQSQKVDPTRRRKSKKFKLRDRMKYEPTTRNESIKISFIILLFMFLITLIFNIIVCFVPSLLRFFLLLGPWIALGGSIGLFIMSLMVFFVKSVRAMPLVVVPLGVVFMSLTVAYGTANLKVLMLFALLAIIFVAATCARIARSTWDFTEFSTHLVVGGVAFTVLTSCLAFVQIFLTLKFMKLQLILLFVGTIAYCIILLLVLQMCLKGKSLTLEKREYCIEAYILYTPIFSLFLSLFMMMFNPK